jgi:hypothetical protein
MDFIDCTSVLKRPHDFASTCNCVHTNRMQLLSYLRPEAERYVVVYFVVINVISYCGE